MSKLSEDNQLIEDGRLIIRALGFYKDICSENEKKDIDRIYRNIKKYVTEFDIKELEKALRGKKEPDIFRINGKEYNIFAETLNITKRGYDNHSFKMKLGISIYSLDRGNLLTHEEVTEYMKEKFSDLIRNSANGKRSLY